MNSEFSKTQKDLDTVRKNYLQAIQNQIFVDKKVIDALTLYNYNQSVPHYIPDLRTTNEKLTDIEELKIALISQLKANSFMDAINAESTIYDLNSNELQTLAQRIDIFLKYFKEQGGGFQLGVPSQLFLKVFRNYIVKLNETYYTAPLEDEEESKTDTQTKTEIPTTPKRINNLRNYYASRKVLGIDIRANKKIEETKERRTSVAQKLRVASSQRRRESKINSDDMMTGSGVGIEPSKRYVQFGNKLLDQNKLQSNHFSLKYMSGGNIAKFPTKTISNHLGNVLRNMVYNKNPDFDDINNLSNDEKIYLENLCDYVCINDRFSLPTPNKNATTKIIDRFQLLVAQLRAGNNSKLILKEIKQLLIQLKSKRIIPIAEANEIMTELLYIE